MSVKHTTQTARPNNSSRDVSADAWNAAHTVTPEPISSILTNHNKDVHDALRIDALTISGYLANTFATAIQLNTHIIDYNNPHQVNIQDLNDISSGTATITAGDQSIIVNHGLSDIPKVMVEPQSQYGIGHYVDTKTSTQFMINIDATQSEDVDFDWIAIL